MEQQQQVHWNTIPVWTVYITVAPLCTLPFRQTAIWDHCPEVRLHSRMPAVCWYIQYVSQYVKNKKNRPEATHCCIGSLEASCSTYSPILQHNTWNFTKMDIQSIVQMQMRQITFIGIPLLSNELQAPFQDAAYVSRKRRATFYEPTYKCSVYFV